MSTLLLIAVVCYMFGASHAIFTVWRTPNPRWFWIALWLMVAGFGAHTSSIVARGWEIARCPLLSYQEVCSFLGWAIAAYFLGTYLWYRSKSFAVFAMPMVFLFALAAWLLPAPSDTAVILKFYGQTASLLTLHAVLFVFAYAAFAILFIAAILYIAQERQLKQKQFGPLWLRLPSLDTCDEVGGKALVIGFVFLTLGILTGIVGSRRLNGVYWQGDPLEFLSLATWLIYFCVVHYRLTAGWRGRRAAWLGIVGFAMVIASLVSIGWLNGLHAINS
ncbi:MAG: cytochrome C assembly family protein [Acidobacteriota bacterium]